MSDFTREIDARYATREEVEQILARARQMRAETMRNAMLGTWAMLQRAMTRKQTGAEPRHA
jgi:hypothetical protein